MGTGTAFYMLNNLSFSHPEPSYVPPLEYFPYIEQAFFIQLVLMQQTAWLAFREQASRTEDRPRIGSFTEREEWRIFTTKRLSYGTQGFLCSLCARLYLCVFTSRSTPLDLVPPTPVSHSMYSRFWSINNLEANPLPALPRIGRVAAAAAAGPSPAARRSGGVSVRDRPTPVPVGRRPVLLVGHGRGGLLLVVWGRIW